MNPTPIKTTQDNGKPLWHWNGTNSLVHHFARLTDPDNTLHLEVWYANRLLGDSTLYPTETDAANDLVTVWHNDGHDAIYANRMLRENGLPATEHTDRPDCTCDGCYTFEDATECNTCPACGCPGMN